MTRSLASTRLMRSRVPLVCLAIAAAALIAAGSASHADPVPTVRPVSSAVEVLARDTAPARAVRVDSDPSTFSACAAPSVLKLHAADDARDLSMLASCAKGDDWSRVPEAEQQAAIRCDTSTRPLDVARLLEGALPLDAATAAHVHAIWRAGQSLGRHRDAFGLVGDSMTVDANFMRPFGLAGQTRIPADLAKQLPLRLFSADSYVAPRAAKVGRRATWALEPNGKGSSALETMVASESPAYAVVLYGANDALEADGVVPILTTIPKHMKERGWPDCPLTPTSGGNERFAVQASVLSADVADLACRRHLPLVDLRWALDPLLNHGVGGDGVHLSVHASGGGVLDRSGLECGYNVRNLVTLRELGRVAEAAAW